MSNTTLNANKHWLTITQRRLKFWTEIFKVFSSWSTWYVNCPFCLKKKHPYNSHFESKICQFLTYDVCLTEICRSPAGESLASMITFFCIGVPSLAELSGASSWMVKISSCSGKSSSRAVSSRKMEFWLRKKFSLYNKYGFRQFQVIQLFFSFLVFLKHLNNILYLSVLKRDHSLGRSQVCQVFQFFRDDFKGDANHSINPWASDHLQPCNV